MRAGISTKCRLCSLIPGLGVELSTTILAGPGLDADPYRSWGVGNVRVVDLYEEEISDVKLQTFCVFDLLRGKS